MGPNQKNGSNSLGCRSRGQRPGCFEVHMDSPNQWCCCFLGANSFVPNHLYEKCVLLKSISAASFDIFSLIKLHFFSLEDLGDLKIGGLR